MPFPFKKMHGLGNDFVVIDARQNELSFTPEEIRAIADRKRGIGCDQLIVIEKPQRGGVAFLRMYNGNGGAVNACGNGTRCAASLLLAEGNIKKLRLETGFGFIEAEESAEGLYAVDMGIPRLDWQDIPLAKPDNTLNLAVIAELPAAVAVSMGNPHAVFFVDDAERIDLTTFGPLAEQAEIFPEKANIEFASIETSSRIRMRVWERDAGITEACGSGACAVLVAAVRRGLADRKAEIILDGGSLTIEWDANDHVIMTGPVATSFTGIWHG